jgi:tetrahydrodipicolinate N-succinyltransferase
MPLVENYRNYVTPSPKQAIKIGNDFWIGTGAMILTSVTIGDGAVIGPMAVVAKDVQPYAVVAGNPARLIRYRFSETQIEALQKIAWCNWPLQKNQRKRGFVDKQGYRCFHREAPDPVITKTNNFHALSKAT